jgi:hypothetical protein
VFGLIYFFSRLAVSISWLTSEELWLPFSIGWLLILNEELWFLIERI